MLRDHDIPESELKYLGDRVYPEDYQAHPEYHGQVMPWYLVGGCLLYTSPSPRDRG